MKHHCCIVIILRWVLCRAWNGIVIDNDAAGGNTQLILPNDVPHTVGNVNFGLPHYTLPSLFDILMEMHTSWEVILVVLLVPQ